MPGFGEVSCIDNMSDGSSLSIFVAVLALLLSVYVARMQKVHNKLSVRPLAQIEVRDMQGEILVKLCNNGVGPLIVSRLLVCKAGKFVSSVLVECMPALPGGWSFFVSNIDGRSMRPGGEIVLLHWEYDVNSHKELAKAESVRGALAELGILVEYQNIYGDRQPVHFRSLEWFGR